MVWWCQWCLFVHAGWVENPWFTPRNNGKRKTPTKPVIQASEAGSSLFRLSVERGGKTAPTWAPGKMGPWWLPLKNPRLAGGFKHVFFHSYLGRWSNLTNIFPLDRNHQLATIRKTFLQNCWWRGPLLGTLQGYVGEIFEIKLLFGCSWSPWVFLREPAGWMWNLCEFCLALYSFQCLQHSSAIHMTFSLLQIHVYMKYIQLNIQLRLGREFLPIWLLCRLNMVEWSQCSTCFFYIKYLRWFLLVGHSH